MSDRRLAVKCSYSRRKEENPKSFPSQGSPDKKRAKVAPPNAEGAFGLGIHGITWEPHQGVQTSSGDEPRSCLPDLDISFMETEGQFSKRQHVVLAFRSSRGFGLVVIPPKPPLREVDGNPSPKPSSRKASKQQLTR